VEHEEEKEEVLNEKHSLNNYEHGSRRDEVEHEEEVLNEKHSFNKGRERDDRELEYA